MSRYLKRWKIWALAILVLWLAYIIWANLQVINPIYLIPFFVALHATLPEVIVGSAIGGCLLTLLVQYIWRRRRYSKRAAASSVRPAASTSTVA
ncbi:MAG: hypothetical protein ACREQX_10855 [Candidatus Binataceae bacterium]